MSFPRAQMAAALVLVLICFHFGYLFGISRAGMIGPDEPRYASIGRAMARSGDWVTPNLWGEPWFEKPPLLYWLMGAGFRAGLGDDTAPRAGVALLSGAFLGLFWRCVARRKDRETAWMATIILGTSAGWVVFSQVGATDLPLAASYGAGMLLALEGLEEKRRVPLWCSGLCFGLAVLAKGLVGPVLALPLAWFFWRRWREFVVPVLLGLAVAAPWYAAMTARHGFVFVQDFFGKHHLARFSDASIAHEQPWWFYLPVLLAGVFPWTPLFVLARRSIGVDRFGKFLGVWLVFGLVFFSAATNKLPGYVLPLLPACCGMLAVALRQTRHAAATLGACVLLLGSIPAIGRVIPEALVDGLSGARWGATPIALPAAAALLAALAWFLERRGRRLMAVGTTGVLAISAVVFLKISVYPVLDREVSARSLWREVESRAVEACVEDLSRDDRYGLNYYSEGAARTLLPDCGSSARGVHVKRR